MNNALIQDPFEQSAPDRAENLRERDSHLVRVIEAIDGVLATREWRTLKELVFEPAAASIEKRLADEAGKPEISTPSLYRLQGEKLWSSRYASLEKLRTKFHRELMSIRKITPGDGAP